MEKRYLGVKEAAEYMSMTVSALYSLTSMRKIPFIKLGKARKAPLKFDIRKLEKWMDEQEVKPFEHKKLMGSGRDYGK